ncbi:MAG TPA: hypothetical protein VNJ07_06160, partial [Chitinophagales bacterium]|nr:hypothetical protein [Chitinophagales bacterium]
AIIENTSGTESANGLAVRLSGMDFPDVDNNYITFFSDNEVRGRIEGQNATDVLTDPEYILHTTLFALSLTNAIAEQIAAATSTTPCVGLGAVVCSPIPSWNVYAAINIALTIAEEAAYQSFVFANLGVAYSSGSGDYAEWLEKQNHAEQFSFGDIVGVKGGKISKNTADADNFMVVSLSPVVLGNEPPAGEKINYEKIAFLGQVKAKVYGRVTIGDYILPSGRNDGYGMAVSPANMKPGDYRRIVGRAWSASDNDLMSYVNVLVGLNGSELAEVAERQQKEIDALKSEVDNMKLTLSQLLPQFEQMSKTVEELKSQRSAVTTAVPYEPAAVPYQNIIFDPEILAYSFSLIENMYRTMGIDYSQSPELKRLLTDRDYQQQKAKELQQRITEVGDLIEKSAKRK